MYHTCHANRGCGAESVTPAPQDPAAPNRSPFVAKLPRTSIKVPKVPGPESTMPATQIEPEVLKVSRNATVLSLCCLCLAVVDAFVVFVLLLLMLCLAVVNAFTSAVFPTLCCVVLFWCSLCIVFVLSCSVSHIVLLLLCCVVLRCVALRCGAARRGAVWCGCCCCLC